jgi:hypothetical protein
VIKRNDPNPPSEGGDTADRTADDPPEDRMIGNSRSDSTIDAGSGGVGKANGQSPNGARRQGAVPLKRTWKGLLQQPSKSRITKRRFEVAVTESVKAETFFAD